MSSTAPINREAISSATDKRKPFVSLVVPAYNEEEIIESSLRSLCEYMRTLEERYEWELIVINDGSADRTKEIINDFAQNHPNVSLLDHRKNFGLGQALRFAFNNCNGDYIVTLDADLTYGPSHIESLLDVIERTSAKIVIASPYLSDGRISGVPWHRKLLSITANKFLALTTKQRLSTVTSMVRAYDAQFLRSIPLKSMDMSIITEIIYKGTILGARIEEIPAHLDWNAINEVGAARQSSMKVAAHTAAILFSGFLFRPFMFFVIPGLLLLVFSMYVNTWMIIHFANEFSAAVGAETFFSRASIAVKAAYLQYPHTFVIGLLSLMLAIQLIGLGMLAAQNKNYFEDVFNLGVLSKRSRLNNGSRDS